jgi:hypothetical protein
MLRFDAAQPDERFIPLPQFVLFKTRLVIQRMSFRDPSIPTIRLQWNPKAKKMALAKIFLRLRRRPQRQR